MKQEAIDLYNQVTASHSEAYELLLKLKQVTSKTRNIEELSDIAYATSQCLKKLEDQRKELKGLLEILEKVVGALWVQQGSAEPIRTDYVTVSPRIKIGINIPSRKEEPEKFTALMQWLQVPVHLWDVEEDSHATVHLHWPGVVERVTERLANGEALPTGVEVDKTYNIYKLTFRGRREVSHNPDELPSDF